MASHPAFSEFRTLTESLAALPESRRLLSLEYELFRALDRAYDAQERALALEIRLGDLEAASKARGEEHAAALCQLGAELDQAVREHVRAQSGHERQLTRVRLALAAAEAQRDSLEELCRSLVRTLEQAAEADTEPSLPCEPRHARASA